MLNSTPSDSPVAAGAGRLLRRTLQDCKSPGPSTISPGARSRGQGSTPNSRLRDLRIRQAISRAHWARDLAWRNFRFRASQNQFQSQLAATQQPDPEPPRRCARRSCKGRLGRHLRRDRAHWLCRCALGSWEEERLRGHNQQLQQDPCHITLPSCTAPDELLPMSSSRCPPSRRYIWVLPDAAPPPKASKSLHKAGDSAAGFQDQRAHKEMRRPHP